MKRNPQRIIIVLAVLLLAVPVFAWGPEGHDIITAKAISVLPEQIRPFYEKNSRLIVAYDVMPDLWKDYHRTEEGPNHYINLDLFATPPSFTDLPKDRKAAEKKYGKSGVTKMGILPWVVEWRYNKLVKAMKKRDPQAIVEQSALLAHYAADAHVPFHATKDYDGKTAAQKGLHGRFEIELLRRYITPEEIHPASPQTINDVLKAAFDWTIDAYKTLDKLNSADVQAHESAGEYNQTYYEAFAPVAEPIAIKQLEKGAADLASLYLSAWQEAGKPTLAPKAAPILWGK